MKPVGPSRIVHVRPWSALFAFALAGCLQLEPSATTPPPSANEGDSILYVSNQSFQQPEAHIVVTLDGAKVFDRDAPVRDEHYWQQVKIDLSRGTHRLVAKETISGTEDDTTFVVDGKRWIVIDYWTGPSRFTFNVSDRPVAFD